MNSVAALLSEPFLERSIEEKLEIKRLGRPLPIVNITQTIKSKNRQFTRSFNGALFQKHEWLCGCDESNALFCFPCLLFGGEDLWTKSGMVDLNHLADRIKKHETSATHMKNVLQFSFFGNVNMVPQLDTECRKTIAIHNEIVKHNRYVLNVMINCIRFCGAFDVTSRGLEESDCTNQNIFNGLFNFSAELDDALRNHLEKATAFKGSYKAIQNEILQIMLEVYHEEISKEIQQADYMSISIIADETRDVESILRLAIIFRYVNKGKPVERFWNLLTPSKRDLQSLASTILGQLEGHVEYTPNKLIAQTYDGAFVNGVESIIMRNYPHAALVHCYAHQLNLIMLNAASMIRNVRLFFADLHEICTFFSNSVQRIAILDAIVQKCLPHSVDINWDFLSRRLNTVYKHRDELIECMEVILKSENINSTHALMQASHHLKTLTCEGFVAWLSLFQKIMPHVEILSGQLQKPNIDPESVECHMHTFETDILKIRNSIDEEFSGEAGEVCDLIIYQARDRFSFTGHLVAATLFQVERFCEYNSNFPDENFEATIRAYPFFDSKKLRTELSVIYSTEEFKTISGALRFFSFIMKNNVGDTFSECVKLLKILLTTPTACVEAERCFSTHNRIKTFLKNTVLQERLSALAMSEERDFIADIPDFNQRVMDKFALNNNHGMDFLYK